MNRNLYSIYNSPTQKVYSIHSKQEPIDFDPVNCIIEPSLTEGGLYLGGIEIASDTNALKALNIGAVLTIASHSNISYNDGTVKYHRIIEVEDVASTDLFSKFEESIAFIDSCRKETSVLIHCFQGVSRSATMVIAYLMFIYGLSFDKAFNYVRERRKQAYPNSGFLTQMRKFETYLNQRKNIAQPNYNRNPNPSKVVNRIRKETSV